MSRIDIPLLLLMLVSITNSSSFSFLTLGDWGGAALGGQDKTNVYAVAGAMAKLAATSNPKFIINTGDNFYWCGIQNTTDYQIKVDYELPYSDPAIESLPWYSVLGNHEYGYNVQAEIDYAMINSRWIMDSRYYTKRIEVDTSSSTYISFIFLDTSPCIAGYRQDNAENWDPCSTQYPTCSLKNTNDDFEGPCKFHENIVSQSCSDQFAWFQQQLAAVPKDDWLIVVGHHPVDEINVFDFTSALQQRGFSIYFNGHAHTLTQYKIDGTGAYVTSGAGALVNTADQSHHLTAAKVLGMDIPYSGGLALGLNEAPQIGQNHSYTTIFNQKVAGFTQSVFNSDFSVLTTNFVSYTGSIVHSFQSNKAGALVA